MRKNQKILKLQNDVPRSNSAAASIRQKRLRCGLTPESFFNKFVQNAWHRCHRRRCDLPWSVALLLFFFQVCLYVRVCHNRNESARRAASTTRNTTECKQAARASVDHCHSYKEKKRRGKIQSPTRIDICLGLPVAEPASRQEKALRITQIGSRTDQSSKRSATFRQHHASFQIKPPRQGEAKHPPTAIIIAKIFEPTTDIYAYPVHF